MKKLSQKEFLKNVRELLSHLSYTIFDQKVYISADLDKEFGKGDNKRVYIQSYYFTRCIKTGEIKKWKGGKHYLSRYMTEDEIVKKAWVAFELTIRHEALEGFRFDNKVIWNPHTSFRESLKISDLETKRQENFDI